MGCEDGLWGWVVGMGCGDGLWGWAGTDATPAAFNLGLCRLRGILSPPSATTTFRRRTVLPVDTIALQAELIYFAATKIRIGRGNVAATTSQAGHSTCRYDGAAGGTVLVRSKDCCRRTVLLAGTIALQRFSISSPDLRIDAAKRSKQGQSAHRFSI